MALDVEIEAQGWAGIGLDDLAQRAVGAALAHFALAMADCEVSLLATDDARMAVLNGDHRGKPQATNVLSWPAQELAAREGGGIPALPRADAFGEIPLGDVALAWETCEREAREQNKSLGDHVTHLLVHGVLHLLGYDHIRDADATLMEGLERAILGNLGLDDPYRI